MALGGIDRHVSIWRIRSCRCDDLDQLVFCAADSGFTKLVEHARFVNLRDWHRKHRADAVHDVSSGQGQEAQPP